MRQAARAALLAVRFGRPETFPCPEAAPTMLEVQKIAEVARTPLVADAAETRAALKKMTAFLKRHLGD
jgi:hypothetical protein